ncbi:MAG: cytochrome c oxidase subunit 3 [Chloroflexota bacterium]
MSAITHEHDHHHDHHNPMEPTRAEQITMNRFGLWVFCLSESFLFLAILAARFYLWRNEEVGILRPDLPQLPALIFTTVLLVSSYFMNRAEVAAAHEDRRNFNISMLITFIMGSVFLYGVVFIEWGLAGEIHILPKSGAFGAVFFAMTGMHAIHVITGLIFVIIAWVAGNRGAYTKEDHWGIEACAIYWHYVDLVWIFFYPAIYLIGTAVHIPIH